MPLPEIEEILKKYKDQEEKVENLFEEIDKKHTNKCTEKNRMQRNLPTYEQAKERNRNILKDLETVKGNLRSKAIFSPTELQWEAICKRYQDEPSLPVTTWKCNIPIYV